MNEHIKRLASQVVLVAAVFLVAAGMQVLAFTEPASAPPGGNVDAPINTGSVSQTKSGHLGIGSPADLSIGDLVIDNASHDAKFCLNGDCVTAVGGSGTSAGCVLPWGSTIADGASVTAYQSSSASNCSSISETRTCTSGTLSGSYQYQSCSSPNLENGISAHTEAQCTTAGGTLVDTGSNGKICGFSGSSCPAGWSSFAYWSQTSARSYSSGTCSSSCTTGSHSSWANISQSSESCSYYYDDGSSCGGGDSSSAGPCCPQTSGASAYSARGCV